jgi:hypothetical protein
MTTFPDRIPYERWIHSHLSIARHYGAIVLNGETYVVDGEGLPFPDLVRASTLKNEKKQKKKKAP